VSSGEHDRSSPDASGGGRGFGDADARHALGSLGGPFLPWSAGSMRPSGLVMVCNDIVLNDRRRVVELGSGISTVLLNRLRAQLAPAGGFTLVSVEHDERWADWVTRQLWRETGDHDSVVVRAPLGLHPLAESQVGWYDGAALAAGLDAAFGTDLIDLLVVDGPPAFDAGMETARAPALPVLWDRLAPGATVVLDDIERPGEQEVLRRWEGEFDVVFTRHETAGVAIGHLP
jgi:predicted O-methyltransferase YrrM